MASKPAVVPEALSGEDFKRRLLGGDSVADVNGWNDTAKLEWMKVRLTGRAQSVFQRLPAATTRDYDGTKKALKEGFEPTALIHVRLAS